MNGEMSFLQVLDNIAKAASDIGITVSALAYLLGVVFCVSSFMLASEAANPSKRGSAKSMAWLWSLGFSALMFALPTTIASISSTFFGNVNTDLTFAYTASETKKLAPLIPILKLIGVIAVIRGLVVLRTVAVYGNYVRANNTLGKGLTLIIAGVLLVHMKETLGVVSSFTGMRLGIDMF